MYEIKCQPHCPFRNGKAGVPAQLSSAGKQEVAGTNEGTGAGVTAAGTERETPFWKSWRIW